MWIPHCKSVHRSDQAFNNKAFRLLVLLVTLLSMLLETPAHSWSSELMNLRNHINLMIIRNDTVHINSSTKLTINKQIRLGILSMIVYESKLQPMDKRRRYKQVTITKKIMVIEEQRKSLEFLQYESTNTWRFCYTLRTTCKTRFYRETENN